MEKRILEAMARMFDEACEKTEHSGELRLTFEGKKDQLFTIMVEPAD
jgi:hypothetical protein